MVCYFAIFPTRHQILSQRKKTFSIFKNGQARFLLSFLFTSKNLVRTILFAKVFPPLFFPSDGPGLLLFGGKSPCRRAPSFQSPPSCYRVFLCLVWWGLFLGDSIGMSLGPWFFSLSRREDRYDPLSFLCPLLFRFLRCLLEFTLCAELVSPQMPPLVEGSEIFGI